MDNKKYYPIMVNLGEKEVLIIGSGNVALRKLKGLINKAKKITIISEKITNEFENYIREIRDNNSIVFDLIEDSFKIDNHYEYIIKSELIFICTDDIELNKQIQSTAKREKVWSVRCDDASESDFINPITLQKEDLILSISTSGASPIYCQYLKKEIEKLIDTLDIDKLKLLDKARKKVKANNKVVDKSSILKKLPDMDKDELISIISEENL